MTKHDLTLIILVALLIATATCAQSHRNIRNSVWGAPITSSASDTLWLQSKGRYIEYDCELNERFYGTFTLVGDTLVLFQARGQYDREEPERGSGKGLFKFLLRGDSLTMIYSQASLGFPPTMKFDSLFTYRRLRQ